MLKTESSDSKNFQVFLKTLFTFNDTSDPRSSHQSYGLEVEPESALQRTATSPFRSLPVAVLLHPVMLAPLHLCLNRKNRATCSAPPASRGGLG